MKNFKNEKIDNHFGRRRKSSGRYPTSFVIKTLSKLAMKGKFLNLIKGISEKIYDKYIILKSEKLNAFLPREGVRLLSFSPLLFNIVLEVLTDIIMK